MKTRFLSTATLLLAIAAVFAFQSCEKDDDTPTPSVREKLVGTWDITSFKVDTSEYMGTVVETASIRFDTISGTQGDFRQTIKYVDEDPAEILDGKYKIENGNQVVMTADGETKTLKASISGANLQLEGTDNGQKVVMKGKKR